MKNNENAIKIFLIVGLAISALGCLAFGAGLVPLVFNILAYVKFNKGEKTSFVFNMLLAFLGNPFVGYTWIMNEDN